MPTRRSRTGQIGFGQRKTVDFSTSYSGAGDCSEQCDGEHPYVVAQAVYLGEDAFLLAGEMIEVNVGHRTMRTTSR